MSTVVLVRHGQASFGAQNYDRLSPLGEQQSTLLGQHWQATGFEADCAWSGSMQRQRVTGERAIAALGGKPIAQNTEPALNEFHHQQLIHAYLPVVGSAVAHEHPGLELNARTLLSDPAIFRPVFTLIIKAWAEAHEPASPIDETWADFNKRCVDGIRRVANTAERSVVFTSGGVITAALREALSLDAPTALRLNWRIWNASVHEFELKDGALSLRGFNDVSHLRLQRDPAVITRI